VIELELATKSANIIQKYQAGEDIDLTRALEEAQETAKVQLDRRVNIPWIQDSILDLLVQEEDHRGFKWRLECLRQSMRPVRPGDFGVIAARPDVGKTSFFTDQLSYMAPQLDEVYPGEDRQILWFNNEGPGKRIVQRLYQSTLNARISELLARKAAGTIVEDYVKAIGAVDRIRILDIHGMWNYEIVDIMLTMRPGIVVFDMIDNIKFGGDAAGARTDEKLEAMYQWARCLGVRFDCVVFATSQISNEGDGLQYPTLGMLKDSKTGKQGASDFQLMIGKSNDPNMRSSRFLSLPKNKLNQEGFDKDPRQEVIFDELRGRFYMPEGTGGIV
jgi:replicative DNA helicase